MWNTPNQIAAAMRQLLREEVGPAVESPLARARLRQVLAVLRDIDWDAAADGVRSEWTLLSGVVPPAGGATATSPAPAPAPAPAISAELPLAQVRSRVDELRRRLAAELRDAGLEGEVPAWSPRHRDIALALARCAMLRAKAGAADPD